MEENTSGTAQSYIWVNYHGETVRVLAPSDEESNSDTSSEASSPVFGSNFEVTPPDFVWEWRNDSSDVLNDSPHVSGWTLGSGEGWHGVDFQKFCQAEERRLQVPEFVFPTLPPLINQLRGDRLPECRGRLRDRLPRIDYGHEIVVVSVDPNYVRCGKFYPTEWMQISNPYWEEFFRVVSLKRDGHWINRTSDVDKAPVRLQRQQNGDIHAQRCGVTVIIQHGDGTAGGITQRTPLPTTRNGNPPPEGRENRSPPRPGRKKKAVEHGVATAHIHKDCPYWRRLLFNVLQPSQGIALRIASDIDGITCVILCEGDGSVGISRMYQKIELLGPLEEPLLDVSIPWGGQEE